MARQSRKSNHRRVYSSLAVGSLIVIAAVVALLIYNAVNSKTINVTNSGKYSTTSAPAADNNANNNRKVSTNPATTLDNGASATSGSSTSSSGSFTVQINPTVIDNGATIHVGTEVSGITTGDCSLTASQSGQPTQQLGTSTVKQDVNYYDCGVFNVSTNSFPADGTWQLNLTVISGTNSASGSSSVTF